MFKQLTKALVIGSLTVSSSFAATGVYQLTIQNLTNGQPITSPVIAVHAPGYELLKVGQKATKALGKLATDGITKDLEAELSYEKDVVRTAVGSGIILPGQSQSIEVLAKNPHFKISAIAMLARTNDAITAKNGLSLKLKPGQSYSAFLNTYDAGVEVNTESCNAVPAPPCNSHNVGETENGIIKPHVGILGLGDLDLARDSFAKEAAKLTIKRIK